MKTSELKGAALGWAVAKWDNRLHKINCGGGIEVRVRNEDGSELPESWDLWMPWYPQSSWAQGGPIIEREKIGVGFDGELGWVGIAMNGTYQTGATPLEAAMRCYVVSKLGNEVELPRKVIMNTNTTSISSSAMLVELSISTWTGRKMDKRASKDVTLQNHAATGVANVSKKLLGDCAELDAVTKFTANARNVHYSCTMPWSDSGLRLLPTAQYFKYHNQMTGLQTEFERRVRAFLDAYDWEIQTAQLKLGTLFDANEYPTVDKLTDKFKFKMNYVPLPDAGDFRIDIEAEAKRELASQYADYYSSQFQSAMKDVWQRAYDAVSKMSERLDYTDATGKKIFRDSLVDNVVEMCNLMQMCNVTNDPVMQSAQQKLKQALQGVTPDALREDEHLRHETKAKVDEVKRIIDNLPGLGM